MRDLYKLRRIKRGCECRVSIRSKHGLPMLFSALKRNAAFYLPLALFLISAAVLSTRIWFIRIDSEEVPDAEIERTLLDIGVGRGASKRAVSGSVIASVLNADRRIANARVAEKGVVLSVRISGSVAPMEAEAEEGPADLIADRDCVISYISVLRGHAEVSVGRAVKKGDILIRGELSSVKEGYAVRAEGLILGRVLYRVTATAPVERTSLVRSGRSKRYSKLTVFGRTAQLKAPFDAFELEPASFGRLRASFIPVTVTEYEAYELVERLVRDTPSGTEERARLQAQEKLNRLIPEGARIISVSTECKRNNDGSVTATITVTTVEKIGTHREI